MELSNPKIRKFLIFSIFSQKKSFLKFLEMELFKKTSFILGGNFPNSKNKKNSL